LKSWIRLCGLNMKFAHTSGHCSPEQLEVILKQVCPEVLIPIHSEFPSLFLERIDENKTKIKLVKEGERVEVK